MDILDQIWFQIPAASHDGKIRVIIGATVALVLLLVFGRRLLNYAATSAKTASAIRTPARAAALLPQLEARLEALLAAMPDSASMGLSGASSTISKDLAAAIQRLAGKGENAALASLAAGDCAPAMVALAKVRAALQKLGASEQEEAAVAREQGAMVLLANPQEALRRYATACVLDHDNAAGWYRLGELKLRMGDVAGARRCYSQTVSLGSAGADPEAVGTALGHLAQLAASDGNREEACELWHAAREVFQAAGMQPEREEVEGWMREAGCA
jgi:hypothetical protein